MGTALAKWSTATEEPNTTLVPVEVPRLSTCISLASFPPSDGQLLTACVLHTALLRVYTEGVCVDDLVQGEVLGRYRVKEGRITAATCYSQGNNHFLALSHYINDTFQLLTYSIESPTSADPYFHTTCLLPPSLSYQNTHQLPSFSPISSIKFLSFYLSSNTLLLATAHKLYKSHSSNSFLKLHPFKHRYVLSIQKYERFGYLFVASRGKNSESECKIGVWEVGKGQLLMEIEMQGEEWVGSMSVLSCLKLTGKVLILALIPSNHILRLEFTPIPLTFTPLNRLQIPGSESIIAEKLGFSDKICLLSDTSVVCFDRNEVFLDKNEDFLMYKVVTSESDCDLKTHLEAFISRNSDFQGNLCEIIDEIREKSIYGENLTPSPSFSF